MRNPEMDRSVEGSFPCAPVLKRYSNRGEFIQMSVGSGG